uniref:Tf2-1-like SH3-like domain-containing protein n=1 Tax=Cajanus cajan TaxID=3821 RepID=A0A151U859_CAJCA|nr:hypothetical protein KK1_008222 [Cajanus cajan]
MKKFAYKKRMPLELKVGDLVLVKLQPYRQHSVALRKNQKLGLRYFGSFPIIQRVGSVAYKLQLPPTSKIHPVFHVSRLKLCKGDHQKQYVPTPFLTYEFGPLLQPYNILQTRTIVRGNQFVSQLLVQWQGTDVSKATWEDAVSFQEQYPIFNLEDKVDFYGQGTVTHVRNALNNKE